MFKKALFATTALVGAGMLVAPAQAADPVKLELGGYMEQWFGYADNDDTTTTDYSNWDQQQDSEVHFLGSTKLDNGIGVSVVIEMTADGDGGFGMDDVFMDLASDSLGTIRLGRADGIAKATQIIAPDVGIENTDGDYANWIAAPGNFTDLGATWFNGSAGGNKITYISPAFSGLTVGASFTPGGATNRALQPAKVTGGTSTARTYEAGFAYARDIGAVAFGLNAGWGHVTRTNAAAGYSAWQGGMSLGYGGFTVSGGASFIDEGNDAATTSLSGHNFDIGASYTTGPYSVSLGWFRTETEGTLTDEDNDVKNSVMLSGAYNLGPGIDLKGSIVHVDYDDETGVAANENSGWAAVGGVAIGF